MSEVRLYDIRCKKEVLPFVLRDLGCGTLLPSKKVRIRDIIKGPTQSGKNAFMDGRAGLIASYCMQKIAKIMRIEPQELAEREQIRFVNGWYYPFFIGKIKDIDRGMGEEI